jgi:hypothetical protein
MHELSSIFLESVEQYLKAVQPKYNGKRIGLREHELQAFFLACLISHKIPVRAEGKYNSNCDKRYDILLDTNRGPKTYVEIEWDAKWTDGFRKRTFQDLEKLCRCTPANENGAFFAINIGNKWKNFPKRPITVYEPKDLPVSARSPNGTALGRYWNNPHSKAPILKLGTRLTYWKYPYDKNNYNVLVLACSGMKTRKGWLPLEVK